MFTAIRYEFLDTVYFNDGNGHRSMVMASEFTSVNEIGDWLVFVSLNGSATQIGKRNIRYVLGVWTEPVEVIKSKPAVKSK